MLMKADIDNADIVTINEAKTGCMLRLFMQGWAQIILAVHSKLETKL